MKPIVFIDLDGVLSDFTAGIHTAMGVEYDEAKWPYSRVWDWFGECPFTSAQANRKCTARFWANLPWTKDGPDILGMIQKYLLPTDCAILTRPMENLGSYTGKAQWVNKHIPELKHRLIPTWVGKEDLAHSLALLIDDRPESVEAFREAGGSAILVPRPWNSLSSVFEAGNAVDHIEYHLQQWMVTIDHPRPKGAL